MIDFDDLEVGKKIWFIYPESPDSLLSGGIDDYSHIELLKVTSVEKEIKQFFFDFILIIKRTANNTHWLEFEPKFPGGNDHETVPYWPFNSEINQKVLQLLFQ